MQELMKRGKLSAFDVQLLAAQQKHSGKSLTLEEEAASVIGSSSEEGIGE